MMSFGSRYVASRDGCARAIAPFRNRRKMMSVLAHGCEVRSDTPAGSTQGLRSTEVLASGYSVAFSYGQPTIPVIDITTSRPGAPLDSSHPSDVSYTVVCWPIDEAERKTCLQHLPPTTEEHDRRRRESKQLRQRS